MNMQLTLLKLARERPGGYVDLQATAAMVYARRAHLHKQAGRISDAIGTAGTNAFGLHGSLLNFGTTLAGTRGDKGHAAKDARKHQGILKSLIPGVGAYRQGRIMRAVADESGERGVDQLEHEITGDVVGRIGSGITGAMAGAGIAATQTNRVDTAGTNAGKLMAGAAVGGVAGLVAPEFAAAMMALVTKTRTKAEQAKHERSNKAFNYIPGVGKYNQYKRMGRGYDKYND